MEYRNIYRRYRLYNNKYVEEGNNMKIIYPKNIFIDDEKVLFGNISLCGKNIILSSMYYIENPIDIENIMINVYTIDDINVEYNKIVIENKNQYEPSCIIRIELNNIYNFYVKNH